MLSALRNGISGPISFEAKVVFPAPFGPAMIEICLGMVLWGQTFLYLDLTSHQENGFPLLFFKLGWTVSKNGAEL